MKHSSNQLANSDSPYLLQHKDNPVNWYPWGDTALEKARVEDKLLIISIGYAACHWCHVMEHESFEDDQVAALMNRNFVSIKVDREQRPDIDNIYMTVAQLVTGHGGWPLNVVALPNGKPIYAGTYFPKRQWVQFLEFFARKYRDERDKLEDQADRITDGVGRIDEIPKREEDAGYRPCDLDSMWGRFRGQIDFERGGTKGAPKFPMPDNWKCLLAFARLTGNTEAKHAVIKTLDAMAAGGIYDHVGGGFARYSTDEQWHVPHFEKMLYDNGQLVSLYSQAYQCTKASRYKEVVFETVDFVERELTDESGGFYSSLDADSEGEEGRFYVWTDDEIGAVLGRDADLFSEYYDVNERGNWEHGNNVLRIREPLAKVAGRYGLDHAEARERIDRARGELFERRSGRPRPGLDDKILTAWNGLMLSGYVDAFLAFGESRFLDAALKNAEFLKTTMTGEDFSLKRNCRHGRVSVDAFLDDYALLTNAYLNLYQATFDEQWLDLAKGLADYSIGHFHDETTGMFYYTREDDTSLIARKMEVSDNVIPSSNSAMALGLFWLGHYCHGGGYIAKARQMLSNVRDDVLRQPAFFSNWARLLLFQVHRPYEVAITGTECRRVVQEMETRYLPHVIYLGAEHESQLPALEGRFRNGTTIHVCRDKVCQQPVTDVGEALEQIENEIHGP
ncbi:MAG: thioredoxin domain-containing protein [Planctomycetota bacterium]